MKHATLQTVCWMGLCLEVPDDWEVVSYGLNPVRGSVYLADRRQQRIQLTWRKVDGLPDLHQMMRDYRSQILGENEQDLVESFAQDNGWVGIRRSRTAKSMTRAVRFDGSSYRLIEMVISWPGELDGEEEAALLSSFAIESMTGDEPVQWSAFGLDLIAPSGWKMTQSQAQPGLTQWTFEREKRQKCVVSRLGACEDWYQNDAEGFLRKQVGKAAMTYSSCHHQGHDACFAQGREAGTRWERWLGRLRHRCDLAWHCPDDHAVYHLTTLMPGKQPLLPGTFAVRCCGDHRVSDFSEPDGV